MKETYTQDLDAELNVLGSMLLLPRVVPDVLAILKPEDFSRQSNSLIFRAIRTLDSQGQQPDPILVCDILTQEGVLEQIGGRQYVHSLSSAVSVASHAVEYATIIKRYAMNRRLRHAMQSLVDTEKQTTPEEIVATLQDALQALEDDSTEEATPLSEMLIENYEHMENVAKSGRRVSGTPSEFHELDDMLSGFEPSSLTIIAGRPGMGKTAFALNLMMGFTETAPNNPSLMFSLEMSKRELTARLIAWYTKLNGNRLKNVNLSDEEWKLVLRAHQELANKQMFVDDSANLSMAEIRARARRLHRKHNLSAVFVDYVQLVKPGKSYDTRDREVSEVSKGLKNLAKELQIPVIALAQLNRNVEGRADKRPGLADLRESGSIEQDADVCIFLYRDEYYDAESKDIGIVELLVRKNRNGPTGECRLAFAEEYGRFNNLPKGRFSVPPKLQPPAPHPCESKDRTENQWATDSERQLPLD